nr:endolytic transglycosylase MltG [uncultured Flavobacterium sp.]
MKISKLVSYVAVLGIFAALIYGYVLYRKAFTPNTNFEEASVYVLIPSDATYNQIQDTLKKYVKNYESLEDLYAQLGQVGTIAPGRYLINKNDSNYRIVRGLRNNIPVKLTFNNQETLEKLLYRISSQVEPGVADLYQTFTEPAFLEEMKMTKENVLAMCMPNTYEVYWNTSPLKIRNLLQKEYIRFWDEQRKQKAEDLGLTQVQISSLAAIVQKETAKVDERPKVAGAYLNRLNRDMLLQADPTVVYAKKALTNDFDQIIKRVYLKDLTLDHPVNTYKYKGIPKGLIAMPDVSSIDAVLNPEKHNYIYFCASVERMGYHEFATTLEEHAKNRQKYTTWLDQQNIE